MRYNTNTNRVVYKGANPSIWADLATDIDYDVKIYDILNNIYNGTILSYDFAVTVKTNSLYKTLLNKTLNQEWYKRLHVITPKLRTLEYAIECNDFSKAQYIINSINGSLMLLLI